MTVTIEGLGKITASKDVLNELVGVFYNASDIQLTRNHQGLSECYSKRATEIYDALYKEGYYKGGK